MVWIFMVFVGSCTNYNYIQYYRFIMWFMIVQIVLRILTVVFYFLCWWLFPLNCTTLEEDNQVKLKELVNEEDSKKEIGGNNNDYAGNNCSLSSNHQD